MTKHREDVRAVWKAIDELRARPAGLTGKALLAGAGTLVARRWASCSCSPRPPVVTPALTFTDPALAGLLSAVLWPCAYYHLRPLALPCRPLRRVPDAGSCLSPQLRLPLMLLAAVPHLGEHRPGAVAVPVTTGGGGRRHPHGRCPGLRAKPLTRQYGSVLDGSDDGRHEA